MGENRTYENKFTKIEIKSLFPLKFKLVILPIDYEQTQVHIAKISGIISYQYLIGMQSLFREI